MTELHTMKYFCIILWLSLVVAVTGQGLPSVYGYFGPTSNRTGLITANKTFFLNGKQIRIISGTIHYYRVHPALWRDRLRKLRAMGANTVETNTPWNVHELHKNQFDFGDGNTDYSKFLDIRTFLRTAQEEDLLVLLRASPYMCAEWDFGGIPSWLQRDPNMLVRQFYTPFLDRVTLFMNNLLQRLVDLQFTRGGSIIALQIENEYGAFSPRTAAYMTYLRDIYNLNGFNESLYYTSDNAFNGDGMAGTLPGLLQTANFQLNPQNFFQRLQTIQPTMPFMAMEYWTGWFTHWGDARQGGLLPQTFKTNVESVLSFWNASINFYVFHGGTSFIFYAGANNIDSPPYIMGDITSYDYDALLSEAGDYTVKYDIARDLIDKYAIPKLFRGDRPEMSRKKAYCTIKLERYLTYEQLIARVPSSSRFQVPTAISMENLPMNNDSGQSFGYIIYRKVLSLSPDSNTIYKGSWPRDVAFLLVNGSLINNSTNNYWINDIRSYEFQVAVAGFYAVDLLVEPLGRNNYGIAKDFVQQKGIAPIHFSQIAVNGQQLTNIEIIALEFTGAWVKTLSGFTTVEYSSFPLAAPLLVQATLYITEDYVADTWIDMSRWKKGIVFVNGFNIGRYWSIGPQQNLYVPAPLLKRGINTITVFEQVQAHNAITFSATPNLGPAAQGP